ncbi:MAG TPA: 4Fe-4S binding protein [Saprospiraceae bacterium]|nr:4Fe-4S binding protein [Saprospiraceae bacterium]
MSTNYKSISVASHHQTENLSTVQKISLAMLSLGGLMQVIYWFGGLTEAPSLWLWPSLLLGAVGTAWYGYDQYNNKIPGVKNNGVWFKSLTSRGSVAWMLGIILTAFYIILYWFPQYLGLGSKETGNTGLIRLFDPLSQMITGHDASQWFVYGALYTFIIFFLGLKFIWKYRYNKYQVFRTISIMFFQTIIAFLLPSVLESFSLPFNDFKNIWPLNYYFFFDWHIDELLASGNFGIFVLFWGILSFLVLTPILTYFYGKRWYCSWVCGCGGLAETAGDPFRQLSDKSLKAWKIERWMIHSILVFVFLMTALVLYTRFTGQENFLFLNSGAVSNLYGFLIGSAFSGVIGVGFYPLMGSRVWCRFGCPMAAYLGLLQKTKSKFRITTNGGQCISCGNCSTYCEMGIDVKSYAQRGQDIVRSSCVGCGICSAVCPRGVLRLENAGNDIDKRAKETRAMFGDFQ